MKKILVGIVIVAVAAAALWQAHRRIQAVKGAKKPERRDVPVAVETQPVRQGVIRDIGVFTGSLVPESQFVVAPKAAGWIKELLVDIGDSVRRNDVIAVLDDAEFTQDVEQARAELQVAKANAENSASDLDLAKREYDRVTALREKQIASAAELDAAASAYNASQTRLKVAQAQVAQKDAALKAAQLQLSYTQVRAFWEDSDPNRVVGERFVDEGTLVQMNQPIVSVLENNPLTAVVFVIERDYPKVKVGQQAAITTDAWPGRTFTGAIRRIAPLLKETSRQARLEIEIANPEHLLKPGMFVRTQLEFDRHDNATLVPLSALVRRDGREGVFLVGNSSLVAGRSSLEQEAQKPSDEGRAATDLRVRFVPVTTGIINGETVEVIEPRISGAVVTLGNHLLEDGSRITLPQASSVAGRSSPEQEARKPSDEGRATSDRAKQGERR
jgi:RND family efflux transporter MFP subunit